MPHDSLAERAVKAMPDHPCHGSGHRLTLGMCEPYAQVSRPLMRRLESRHGVMPAPKIST